MKVLSTGEIVYDENEKIDSRGQRYFPPHSARGSDKWFKVGDVPEMPVGVSRYHRRY